MKHSIVNSLVGVIFVIVLLCVFPWALPVAIAAAVWHFIGWLFKPDQD